MSTKWQIEFVGEGQAARREALLYHHTDGYPEFAMKKIRAFLAGAAERVTQPPCLWWDSERVAACFVAASIGAYEAPSFDPNLKVGGGRKGQGNGSGIGIPDFQPCVELHGDIEYLYRICLGAPGQAKITTFSVGLADDGHPPPKLTRLGEESFVAS